MSTVHTDSANRQYYLRPLLFVASGMTAGLVVQALPAWAIALLIGGAVGWLCHFAWRTMPSLRSSVLLQDISIGVVPGSSLTFVVDQSRQHVAWEIFVHLTTRVATQPLPANAGDSSAALQSMYQVFTDVRDMLLTLRLSPVPKRGERVEVFAVKMLNDQLRPFLARWHPVFKRAGSTALSTDQEEEFRRDLESSRQNLIRYAHDFGKLAGVYSHEDLLDFLPKS